MNLKDFPAQKPTEPRPLDAHWDVDRFGPSAPQKHASIPQPVTPQQILGYAWAAGFLDGEGCITLARVRRNCGNRINYRARVTVPQNCLKTLTRFRDIVGERCFEFQLPHRATYKRPVYQLTYDGIHALRLLRKLRPFLVRKAAEADVLFEFYRDGEVGRHFGPKGAPAEIWHFRSRCYEALRCLK